MQSISVDLATALGLTYLNPKVSCIMKLSNNSNKNPTVVVPYDVNKQAIIDGYSEPSMKIAFADSDSFTDDGCRVFPSADFTPQVPWISSTISNGAGAFSPTIEIRVEYSETVFANKILLVGDPFGDTGAGEISLVDIYVRRDWGAGQAYQIVLTNFVPSGFKTELYAQDLLNASIWSTTVNRANNIDLSGIKIVVKSIHTTGSLPKPLVIYELDAMLEEDISDDVIDWQIQKVRDLSSTNLSPIGLSSANTLTLNLVNDNNKFNNNSNSTIFKGMLNNNNIEFELAIGFMLANTTYEYVKQGTYFADEWAIAADTASVSVTCRDKSKFLQIFEMDPILYDGYLLHNVIKDVVERAGIRLYDIDTSVFTEEELATGTTLEIAGLDEVKAIPKNNLIWSAPDQTAWEFLQTVAAADLGVFYFDETNTFIYKTKESLSDVSRPEFTPVATLADSSYIIDSDFKTELVKNSITLNYTIPKLSDTKVGLWEVESPTILSSTALGMGVDAAALIFDVGDISDWPKEGYFAVDDEIVKYDDRTDSSFIDCERAQFQTLAVPHSASPTTNTNWSTTQYTWQQQAGTFRVVGNGSTWGYAFTNANFPDKYSISGRFKVTAAPWKVAVLARARDSHQTFYKFTMKTVAGIGASNGTGDAHYYVLERFNSGAQTTLATDNRDFKILTDQWHEFYLNVDGTRFGLFVDGTKVLHYNDMDANAITDTPLHVGLGAINSGTTYFDNFVVAVDDSSGEGEVLSFIDPFGAPIYEVRKYDATYSVTPAKSINFLITQAETTKIVLFEPGPFSTQIAVENKLDKLNLIEGNQTQTALEGLPEFFILYGYGVNTDNQQTLTKIDKDSIRKYGKQDIDITLPWVQSKIQAKFLLKYLVDVYSTPAQWITANIWAMPHLQISDMVTINYSRLLDLTETSYHVTQINLTGNSQGITQNLILRKAISATSIPVSVGSVKRTKNSSMDTNLHKNFGTVHSSLDTRIKASAMIKSFNLASFIIIKTSKNHGVQADLRNVKVHNMQADLRKTMTAVHMIDAKKSNRFTKVNNVDAKIKQVQTKSSNIHALTKKTQTNVGPVDALIKKTLTISSNIDSLLA